MAFNYERRNRKGHNGATDILRLLREGTSHAEILDQQENKRKEAERMSDVATFLDVMIGRLEQSKLVSGAGIPVTAHPDNADLEVLLKDGEQVFVKLVFDINEKMTIWNISENITLMH
jgi:hypothetical protein